MALARRIVLARYAAPEQQIAKIGSLFATQVTGLAVFTGGRTSRGRDAVGRAIGSGGPPGASGLGSSTADGLRSGPPEPQIHRGHPGGQSGTAFGLRSGAGTGQGAVPPQPIRGGDSWPEGFLIGRVPSVLGYDPIIPAAYVRYLAAADGKAPGGLDPHEPKVDRYDSPLMDRLNVKYILAEADILSDPALTLIMTAR